MKAGREDSLSPRLVHVTAGKRPLAPLGLPTPGDGLPAISSESSTSNAISGLNHHQRAVTPGLWITGQHFMCATPRALMLEVLPSKSSVNRWGLALRYGRGQAVGLTLITSGFSKGTWQLCQHAISFARPNSPGAVAPVSCEVFRLDAPCSIMPSGTLPRVPLRYDHLGKAHHAGKIRSLSSAYAEWSWRVGLL